VYVGQDGNLRAEPTGPGDRRAETKRLVVGCAQAAGMDRPDSRFGTAAAVTSLPGVTASSPGDGPVPVEECFQTLPSQPSFFSLHLDRSTPVRARATQNRALSGGVAVP
jgi:hypothetical protein